MAITKAQLREALNVINEFNEQVHQVYQFLGKNNARNALACSTSAKLSVECIPDTVLIASEIDWNLDKIMDVIYNDGTFDRNADIFFMSKKELEEWLKLYQAKEAIKQTEEYKQYLTLKEKFTTIDKR